MPIMGLAPDTPRQGALLPDTPAQGRAALASLPTVSPVDYEQEPRSCTRIPGSARMAIFHFHVAVIKRSEGRSAVATAAYQARERIEDENSGQTHDWRAKGGCLHAEIVTPAGTPDWMRDRAQLANAVERAEKRRDSQLCRWIDAALPEELTHEQHVELVRGFVKAECVSQGMIADFAIHAPGEEGDHRNGHVHFWLTMRSLTSDGFGPKVRDWNSPEMLEGWREAWAEHTNRILEREGHAARIDHRTLEAQGIDRTPTIHLGPASSALERQGIETDRGDQNREAAASNDNTAANAAEIVQLENHIADLDRQIERLKRLQAVARHSEAIWQRAERAQGQETERGAIPAPERETPPTGPPAATLQPSWRMPETAPMAKDPTPPPVQGREQENDPDAALRRMDGTKHRAVNTMAPTPEDIPGDPEARANYYRALSGTPHPGNVKDANDRAKAGREQEARLKAAGQEAEPPPQPRTAGDDSIAEIKRKAEEKAKEQPPRVIDDDRGRGRD
jgi:hypothetical protein